MVVVGVDDAVSVDTEHPGASNGVELVDGDVGGGGVDVDNLRLAVEGGQAALTIVLREDLFQNMIERYKGIDLTENQLQRPAPVDAGSDRPAAEFAQKL